jgi:hypothetical protein
MLVPTHTASGPRSWTIVAPVVRLVEMQKYVRRRSSMATSPNTSSNRAANRRPRISETRGTA